MNFVVLAGAAAISAVGCAAGPDEVRIQGLPVAATLVDSAERGRPQACLALSQKLWERDALEALRYLRKGAELRDAECCRRYLVCAESATVNLSQRVYARLFIEGVLRQGAVLDADGEDLRDELYGQLLRAWQSAEPRCPAKAKQLKESQRVRDARVQEISLYAGEAADEMKRWLQVPLLGDGRVTNEWAVFDANAWGGGSDRLLLGTNVLAFLVNAQGEPSFRGSHLWICNLGSSAVTVTSLPTGLNQRELLPGQELTAPLLDPAPTTGISVSVRYRRPAR